MAESDALRDYKDVVKAGLYTKFMAGRPLTLRVLTTDPVVSETEFTDKKTGEVNLSTRYAFIVYNFTEDRAQIMQVGPGLFSRIGELHNDNDFGANIRNIDIKITPKGEKLERTYTVDVLPKTQTLTNKMIEEAKNIDLDGSINDSKGRLTEVIKVGKGGEADLKDVKLPHKDDEEEEIPPEKRDIVIEDIGDEPINLDEIPF